MVATLSVSEQVSGNNSDIEGLVDVERLFSEQLSPLRLHPGAALAVYRHGRLVLDLTAGFADTQQGQPVRTDTLFLLFSSTKPLASVSLWQQIERGAAGLDDPVAEYWPAFAGNGKAGVTLRHVLSHRGGFPLTPPTLTPERWGDWTWAVRTIEAMPLSHEPGAVSAYHRLTQQWVCAELVHRLDGRAYGDYLRAEITGPLEMVDTVVGLPEDKVQRAALLHATESTMSASARSSSASTAWRSVERSFLQRPDSPLPATWPASMRHWPLEERSTARAFSARRQSSECFASRLTAMSIGPSMCRSAVDSGSSWVGWPIHGGTGPARRAPRAPSGTAGSAPRSAGA